jgi:hypothetical protein
VHAWIVRWTLSGTESALTVAVIVASLYLLAGVLLAGTPAWLAGAALGAAALSRPEGLLYAALGLAAICAGAARRARRTLEAVAGAAPLLLAYLVVSLRWHPPPVADFAARVAGVWTKPGLAAASIQSAVQIELATDALPLAAVAVLLALGTRSAFPAASGRRALWLLLAAWPPLLALSFAALGMPVGSRSMIPAAPCVLLLGIASLRWVAATTFAGRARHLLPAFVAAFALQNGLLAACVEAPRARARARELRASLVPLGIWARDRTPPGAVFAGAEIGAFGYCSDRRVLDLAGVVTPALAPLLAREGYDAVVKRLLFEGVGRPDYLIDRHPLLGRLEREEIEGTPYRALSERDLAGGAAMRLGDHGLTVYSIDWSVVDRTRLRVAVLY